MRQAPTNVGAVNPVLVLILIIVAGLALTRIPSVTERVAKLPLVHAAGTPLLLLGVVLGPLSGVLSDEVLDTLAPVMALAIGWTGAAFGARLPWRLIRRVPPGFLALASLPAGGSFLAVTGATIVLALLIPALRAAWQPLALVALTHGALAAVAASAVVELAARLTGVRHARARRLALGATIQTAWGALAFTLVLAADHPRRHLGGPLGGAGWLVLVLGSGVLLGVMFLGFSRLRTADDLPLALLGTVLFGAGVGYAAGLSPFIVCAIGAAIVANYSPERRAVARRLAAWEPPIYVVFMILAGALLRLSTLWLVPAACVLAAVRIAARWGAGRLERDRPSLGLAGIAQGSVVLALGLNFLLVYRGLVPVAAEAVLSVVVIGMVLAQLAAPYCLARALRAPQLTSSPAPAEVS